MSIYHGKHTFQSSNVHLSWKAHISVIKCPFIMDNMNIVLVTRGIFVAHLFSFFVLSYCVSGFCIVTSITIYAWKRCSVRLCLQCFVGVLMSFLHYFCLFTYSGVQHILCCVFVLFCLRLVYPMFPVSLDCPFLIAPSVFSNVYLLII